MADLREVVFASNRERQNDLKPKVGRFYSRDGGFLVVTAVTAAKVSWRTEAGQTHSASLADFASRAVDAVSPGPARSDYLGNAWQLAATRTIPKDVRALAVQRAARRAPDDFSRDTVRRWARSLSAGMEPTR